MIKKQFPQFVPDSMTSVQQIEWVYEDLSKRLNTYACFLLGSQHDAEEIVQELFADLSEKKQQFNNYGEAKGILIRATRNRCIDTFRKRRRQQNGYKRYMDANTVDLVEDLLMQEEENDGLLEIIERLGGLDQYIQQLSSPYKEAFISKYLNGKSYPEICEELQIKVTVARNYMVKAKKELRQLLKQSGIKFPFLSVAMVTLYRITIIVLTYLPIYVLTGNLLFLIPITII